MTERLDILAFGAHPDDVEIGMAGTIAKFSKTLAIGICDLTLAELSSNGTIEERQGEAMAAAELLGVAVRLNLQIPDRGIAITKNNISKLVDVLRTYKPKVVCFPYEHDRHPDHGHAAALVKEAIFSSGIGKFEGNEPLAAHKVHKVYQYHINGYHKPDVTVDITSEMESKIKSLMCYKSQFTRGSGVKTPLTEGYLETIRARERMYGQESGVTYAEGFTVNGPVLLGQEWFGDLL